MADYWGVDVADGTCSVEGCAGTRLIRRGLCIPHYERLRRTGDVQAGRPVRDRRAKRLYQDAEWCRARYEDDLFSFEEIAALAGCCIATVHKWLKHHGIKAGTAHERTVLRGNALTGERNPQWKGSGVCACGQRKHRAATRCQDCFGLQERTERNPNWRGAEVTYGAAHDRVRALLGRSSVHVCVGCGEQASDWAYTHTDREEKTSPEGYSYSVDPRHYQPMCARCHRRFDRAFLSQHPEWGSGL